mmetsp:Transcript_17514/g.28351  ORF Transcript_17514/g.28351 Transcript_17514/m.28351 type:complete len:293 (+) Transcript_17514:90-968(+)
MKWFIHTAILALIAAVSKGENVDFKVVVGVQDGTLKDGPWEEQTRFGGVLKGEKVVKGCHMPKAYRHVEDGFLSDGEADILLKMVERGMGIRDKVGGPTILDVNSGYLKDGDGLVNIYQASNRVEFSKEEYEVYANMFDRIREKIMQVNGLSSLYFTAPTFVARTVGSPDWHPKEPHDEYWQPHVDKENTFHYDYSGLVYLSTHGEDFTGGEFLFLDGEGGNKAVLPKKGRFITFASGRENPHRFLKVKTGTRYAFSMWFTCDESKQFSTFLDGEAHETLLTPDPVEAKDEL